MDHDAPAAADAAAAEHTVAEVDTAPAAVADSDFEEDSALAAVAHSAPEFVAPSVAVAVESIVESEEPAAVVARAAPEAKRVRTCSRHSARRIGWWLGFEKRNVDRTLVRTPVRKIKYSLEILNALQRDLMWVIVSVNGYSDTTEFTLVAVS